MDNQRIASELVRLAKSLVAGSVLKELVEIEDLPYEERVSAYLKIQRALRGQLIDEYVDSLKKNPPKDPTMVFAGSLSYQIEEEISKRYWGKTYPGVFQRIQMIAPRGKAISAKSVLKGAYDKLYGRGVFEQLLKNN